jgi:hypothetical protein
MIHPAMFITLDSFPTAHGAATMGAAGTADFVAVGHQLDHCHMKDKRDSSRTRRGSKLATLPAATRETSSS